MRPCVSVLLLATELTTHLLAALGGDKPIVGVVHSRHQEESTRPLPPFTETTLPPGDGAVSLAAWILRYGGNVSSAVSIKDVGGVRGGVTSEAMPEMKTVVKVVVMFGTCPGFFLDRVSTGPLKYQIRTIVQVLSLQPNIFGNFL